MNEQRDSAANRESQVKLAQGRVAAVEKYYGLFCETLGSVIRKSARLRNKSDIFVHQLKDYAETEKLSATTTSSLLSFVENLATVQDYRNTEVQRLEAKVLKPLTKYGDLCKTIKSSIKNSQSTWTREKKQSEKLQKLQQKVPPPTPQIVQAQSELQKTHQQAVFHDEQLLIDVDKFESTRLADMKSVLSEFVHIEMIFHARALEYLSRCYEAAQQIETVADMGHFQATLRELGGASQTFPQSAASSLSQLAAQRTVPPNYSHQRSAPVNSHHHLSPMSMYDDDEDDSEEEDDYDDEDNDS
ncbi:hypothetical protein BsWGS_16264 [Bradybaena similaris]